MSLLTPENEKKKCSLTIADMTLSIITDATPDEVDRLASILNRKIRDINLKSRSCSKHEAALLCALEFCAESLAISERLEEAEQLNEKYEAVLDAFKKRVAAMEATEADLRRENALLRSLLDSADVKQPPVTPSEFLAQVADAQTQAFDADEEKGNGSNGNGNDNGDGNGDGQSSKAETQTVVEEERPKSRSRVGSMFDLLSFNEV